MSCIIGLTTYPVKHALHGGQRRIRAFSEFYRRFGLSYEALSIYEPSSYTVDQVGPADIPLKVFESELPSLPFIGDLLSGLYGANHANVVEHFANVVRQKSPVALVLEQPFMWPLLKKMQADPLVAKIPVIYSSQNWEAPLKLEMLVRCGVDRAVAQSIEQQIVDLERRVVAASNVVIACSEADAQIYRKLAPTKRVVLIKNGVDRAAEKASIEEISAKTLFDDRYLFFVGSAYPPNIDGICDLLFNDGIFFMPPRKGLAICGGVSTGVFQDPRYQRFLGSNSERVTFFNNISDDDLNTLKASAHAIILPITFGGGSNLKTAEALASGKWVVATTTAMRGFETFIDAPGVVVADGRDFRKAVMTAFASAPLDLSPAEKQRRESVYWDRCFGDLTPHDIGLLQTHV